MKAFTRNSLLLLIMLFILSGVFVPVSVGFDGEFFSTNTVFAAEEGGGFINFIKRFTPLYAITEAASNYVTGVLELLRNALPWILLQISGYFFLIAARMFEFTLNHLVQNMPIFITSVEGIHLSWKLLRDVVNMAFIFVLLYISIATILRIEGYGAKRLLSRIIIIALLINFSFFFTKIAIDASNVMTTEFVNGIQSLNPETYLQNEVRDQTSEQYANVGGVAGPFIRPLYLSTIFHPDVLKADNLILVGIMGSIFLLISAWIFFAGAFLFITRFVMFVFLLVISPLAFAGMVLPETQKYSKEWWDHLWRYALVAPIYTGLLLVVAVIINDKNFVVGLTGNTKEIALAGGFKRVIDGGAASIDVVINFAVIAGLMIGSLYIANRMSVRGAATMSDWGKRAGRAIAGGLGRTAITVTGARRGYQYARMRAGQWAQNNIVKGKTPFYKNLRKIPFVIGWGDRISQMGRDDIEAEMAKMKKMSTYALRQKVSGKKIPGFVGRSSATERIAAAIILADKSPVPKGDRYDLAPSDFQYGAQQLHNLGGREYRKQFEKVFHFYSTSPADMVLAFGGGYKGPMEIKPPESDVLLRMAPEKAFRHGLGQDGQHVITEPYLASGGELVLDENGEKIKVDERDLVDFETGEMLDPNETLEKYQGMTRQEVFDQTYLYLKEDMEKIDVPLDKQGKVLKMTQEDESGAKVYIEEKADGTTHFKRREFDSAVSKDPEASRLSVTDATVAVITGKIAAKHSQSGEVEDLQWKEQMELVDGALDRGLTEQKLRGILQSSHTTDDGLHMARDLYFPKLKVRIAKYMKRKGLRPDVNEETIYQDVVSGRTRVHISELAQYFAEEAGNENITSITGQAHMRKLLSSRGLDFVDDMGGTTEADRREQEQAEGAADIPEPEVEVVEEEAPEEPNQ